jgi:hypothetical protein
VTENNLSYTSGNIFNIDESGSQINIKSNPALGEQGYAKVHLLSTGERSENKIMLQCCWSISAPCSNIQVRQQDAGFR